jgi:hypothetical protein
VQPQRELSGVLFKNDKKTTAKHPDYKGRATIDGQEFYLSAWIKEGRNGKFMSLSFKSSADQRESASNGQRAPMDDEDIPF